MLRRKRITELPKKGFWAKGFSPSQKIVELRLLVAVILGFLLSTSESLRFELQSGHTKCIVEDMKANAMTVGKYSVVNPDEGQPLPASHKLTVRVRVIEILIWNQSICSFT